jgi:hypothetical protein
MVLQLSARGSFFVFVEFLFGFFWRYGIWTQGLGSTSWAIPPAQPGDLSQHILQVIQPMEPQAASQMEKSPSLTHSLPQNAGA